MKIDLVRIKSISISDENSYYSDKEKYPVKLKGHVSMKLDGSDHEITVKLTPEQATAIVAIVADGIASTVQSAALTLMQQIDPVGHAQLLNQMNSTSVLELMGETMPTPQAPDFVDVEDDDDNPERAHFETQSDASNTDADDKEPF